LDTWIWADDADGGRLTLVLASKFGGEVKKYDEIFF